MRKRTIQASGTAMINLMGGALMRNQWIREMTINAGPRSQGGYGDENTLLVFAPVWSAVRRTGQYYLGAWTDTVFTPEKMNDFMPELGEGETEADPDGNFHCGVRISTLTWANLCVVSRPDPKGETYVSYLYKDEEEGSETFGQYCPAEWDYEDDNNVLHEHVTVIPASFLDEEDLNTFGFDPLEAIDDEGWHNRLTDKSVKKNPSKVPTTLFVLVGRNGADTFLGNDPNNMRPITRSVYNDRIWEAPVRTWAWEIGQPSQRDTWLDDAPDGKIVGWKVDSSHQWRQNYGLAHMFRPTADDGSQRLLVNETVTHPDGTTFGVFVIDPDVTSFDNAQYQAARGKRDGAFVIDFNGENYHHGESVVGFGVYNGDIARNTFIRIIPPTRKLSRGVGTHTDPQRTSLLWDNGGASMPIDRKLDEWKQWFNQGGMPQALVDLLEQATISASATNGAFDDMQDLALELGDLYQQKGRRLRAVTVPGPRQPRRRRTAVACPECGQLLPLPGHADGCSRKPLVSVPAPEIPQGEEDWDGDVDDAPAGKQGKGGPPVTVEKEVETMVPAGFPEIVRVDRATMNLTNEFLFCDWVAPTSMHPNGMVLVGYGDPGKNNDRTSVLDVAVQRLAEKWNVKAGSPKMVVLEDKVWLAIRRLVAGSTGHFKGQAQHYSALDTLWNTSGSEEVRWGLSWSLLGIEHIERFAQPILAHVLGKQLNSATTTRKPRVKKTA